MRSMRPRSCSRTSRARFMDLTCMIDQVKHKGQIPGSCKCWLAVHADQFIQSSCKAAMHHRSADCKAEAAACLHKVLKTPLSGVVDVLI